MLHFALSYVILFPSVPLRIQRCFSFHLYFPTPSTPVRFDKRHIQAQAERLLTVCSALGQVHSMVFASSIPVGKSFDLFTVTHSLHSGMAVLPPFSPLRQYGLHPSISFQTLSSQTPPPLSETLLSLVSALTNTHPHSHPTLPCLCHTIAHNTSTPPKTQVC